MRTYVIKRCLAVIPLLVAISFLSFTLIALVPADPAEVALRVNEIIPTPESVAAMRAELGLDQPFLLRYVQWLGRALQLDFGKSYINDRLVIDEILRCLPATLKLAAAALLLVIAVSVPVGVLGALYANRLFDRLLRIMVFIGTAMPGYWVGLLLIWFFSIKLNLLPTSGSGSLQHLLLPAAALSLTYISTYVRLIRSNMLENMRETYVLYGRVRGLSEKRILLRHVLKNSLQTSITALGMSIPQLLAGTVIIENIFAWPGVGRLCISAIFNRDYPVIQAYILLMAVLFILCNLIVDIVHHSLDPRLREGR
ncbi:ABC transporter permease subunit|uniref:Nickel import system permease protein NikB n=1 Tax=Dendrosporobacter quercicolus TaxID=146817 RepID=A0A1G9QWU8_9FIRM|nr:nickel/cobalt ABC transporter permease [Dendrosporobacter quercicolus]NSL48370.1 ABC transporter permease subunit [Dendrosporobacter quercicolus DSM 1736]SDM14715.1 nickel transport system permease protein [Dendrosporobacter quercicolus]